VAAGYAYGSVMGAYRGVTDNTVKQLVESTRARRAHTHSSGHPVACG
jgi:hypothetical protein